MLESVDKFMSNKLKQARYYKFEMPLRPLVDKTTPLE